MVTQGHHRRLLYVLTLLMGFSALCAAADEFDNPLLPVHNRSHHQVRNRASRSARVDLDHAIEHIDDEHKQIEPEQHKDSPDVELAATPETPEFETVLVVLPQTRTTIREANRFVRFGRAPPQIQ
ncbi:MAG TPA: hypothetical protein VE621_14670 [Bryobacteraceae bacterium]|jgi:hypothetical protein|nr:hypothetical protein [Bryobacteraceae bacterium]